MLQIKFSYKFRDGKIHSKKGNFQSELTFKKYFEFRFVRFGAELVNIETKELGTQLKLNLK